MKVWDRAGITLLTPGSVVRCTSSQTRHPLCYLAQSSMYVRTECLLRTIPFNCICNMTTFRKKSFYLLTRPLGLRVCLCAKYFRPCCCIFLSHYFGKLICISNVTIISEKLNIRHFDPTPGVESM